VEFVNQGHTKYYLEAEEGKIRNVDTTECFGFTVHKIEIEMD
jgi:hypothetical protein